ncbi:MAG: DUF6273 domain-containing protein [Treponema sp.]|nr:DUF6273 domain-containing protein [Treponema sp.]
MKTLKNKTVCALGALLACAALAFGMAACSSGSDTQVVYVPVETSGGGTQSGGSGTGNGTGGEQAQTSAASGAYTKIGTQTINGTVYDLVTFGLWPQTIKASAVEVSKQCESKTVGDFTYYKGSDGQWYAEIKETAYKSSYKYSDGTTVGVRSADSYKWFKVEPIKWRVLTTDYNGTGKKLLLAESILTNCAYYVSDWVEPNRTIGGKTVRPNNWEHSKVRAFLNGLSYQKKEDGAEQAACDDFLGKGFLQTAFSDAELTKIADTSVDNSARSTNTYDKANQWNNGENQWASDTPTTDKVFLLSEQEATTVTYGFDEYDDYKGDARHNESARIRQTTDYAKASGAEQSTKDGYGGWWWLRSPYADGSDRVQHVGTSGGSSSYMDSRWNYGGVVPALCVSN